ncbi:MAG: TRAP transporter TatT component family protein, partial [Candidatus Poribacteria bacterium]|nr:TRAP transporter TatT component family protein [Candidatus Poribacteria bacterium]
PNSYAGFLEDRMEAAEIAGDYETAAEMRTQAIDHYKRAEAYAFDVLTKSDEAFKEPRSVDMETFRKALQKLEKKQVEPLFWAAYAVARGISLQKDDPMQVIDLVRV